MICPCKYCSRRGCGKEHDTCKEYMEWCKVRAEAKTRRDAAADATSAKIQACIRTQRKMKR